MSTSKPTSLYEW